MCIRDRETVLPNASALGVALGPVQIANMEDGVETLLDDLGVAEAWRIAPVLVEAGYGADDLGGVSPDSATQVVEALATRAEVAALIAEISEGSKRRSELVGALKSYSYLDQAPVQDVDVARGIDDTLLILKSKTAGITIVREYDPSVPDITAHGS